MWILEYSTVQHLLNASVAGQSIYGKSPFNKFKIHIKKNF